VDWVYSHSDGTINIDVCIFIVVIIISDSGKVNLQFLINFVATVCIV